MPIPTLEEDVEVVDEEVDALRFLIRDPSPAKDLARCKNERRGDNTSGEARELIEVLGEDTVGDEGIETRPPEEEEGEDGREEMEEDAAGEDQKRVGYVSWISIAKQTDKDR